MNIAIVSELDNTKRHGGEQQAIRGVYEHLQKKLSPNDTIHLHSYTSPTHQIKTKIPTQIRIFPLIRDIIIAPFIGRSFLKNHDQYDIVHVTSITFFAFAPKHTSQKKIISLHNIPSDRVKIFKKLGTGGIKARILINKVTIKILESIERRSLMNADIIIALKEEHITILNKDLRIPKEKFTIIPNAVNKDRFQPATQPPLNQILFIGRANESKGLDTLLKSMQSIDAKLVIVTKMIDPALTKYVDNKKIILKTSIAHDKIQEEYQKSKVFILPSLVEDQPLTILEAMACSLPVVTTPEGSGGLVRDGKEGFLVPIGDDKRLADAITTLLNNEQLRKKIGTHNREHVTRHHSWDTVTAKHLDIYHQLTSS
jgi:glycosyltransferase involved in cell wall biosynthesis